MAKSRTLTLTEKAESAFKAAIRRLAKERERIGEPLIIWKNGRVVRIPASQAL